MQGVLSTRSVIRIAGEDARNFLQGLVTQDVLHIAEGNAVFTALLTPQGKILFDFFLVPAPKGFFIDCDMTSAAALLKRLALYKLRAKVAISNEPDLAVAIGRLEGSAFASYPDPRLKELPHRIVIARERDASSADDDYNLLRLSLGVPEFGRDFEADEVFLLDVNYDALNAVSYQKGCFVGQEVTSRMKRKAEVRKRTLIARFDGEAPAKGTPLMSGDAAVGELLSGRNDVALALVRLDRLKAAESEGIALTADGRALQIAFPAYLERG
ncbi:MAG: YgfZ/GcvT domain-containing protein [Pseudomonadota bacterium]